MLSVSGFQAVGDEGMSIAEGAGGGERGVKRKPRTDRQMESEKRRTTQCTSTLEHKRQTLSMSELRTRLESTENIDG